MTVKNWNDALREEYSPWVEQIDVSGSVTFVGLALPGSSTADPVWQMFRITETGQDILIEWADSSDKFDNVYDDRVGLTYG